MIKKFVILLWFFAVAGFASLNSKNTRGYQAVLPDSILNCEKIQRSFDDTTMFREQIYEMPEKLEKLMDKLKELKAMSDEIGQKIRMERFDDTGLIRGKVKYFIRIWKHPQKEKFNMPIFK